MNIQTSERKDMIKELKVRLKGMSEAVRKLDVNLNPKDVMLLWSSMGGLTVILDALLCESTGIDAKTLSNHK